MPITPFQSEVLRLLAVNRNPDSYIAGGIAINKSRDSSRFSKDIDIFHDAEESVKRSFKADEKSLLSNGYSIDIERKEDSLIRATITKLNDSLKLEWVRDSAFRFYPVIADPDMGYRLHDIDLATNKCLALANRNEARDVIDLVQIHDNLLSLPANIWAACGKDPGFSPGLLLNQLSRNAKIYPEDIASELLAHEIDIRQLKMRWLQMIDTAREIIDKLPPSDLGCIYIKKDKVVKEIVLSDLNSYQKHFGSVGGSWPRVVAGT